MQSTSAESHTKSSEDGDVGWSRNVRASILSRLPSHRAFNSDCGATLSRSLSRSRRRHSLACVYQQSVQSVRSEMLSQDILNIMRYSSVSKPISTSSIGLDECRNIFDEQRQRQSVRSMTVAMSVKRHYRILQSNQEESRPFLLPRDQILDEYEKLVRYTHLKQRQRVAWQRFKDNIKNALYQLELWAGSFKAIEGRFGTATMSFFRFIRWLLFLNLFMAVVMSCIILIPHFVMKSPMHFRGSVNMSASMFHRESVHCTVAYMNSTEKLAEQESTFQAVLDVLQGTGWMEPTVLFYGVFFNKTYGGADVEENLETYNMSLAYILATGAVFLSSFILIIRNSAKGVKSGITSSDSNLTQYCDKVFGGWDCCITDEKAAYLKHISIYQEFESDLHNQTLQLKLASRTTKQKIKLYSLRVVVNVFVVALLGGALYLIWYTNEQMVFLQKDLSDQLAIVQFVIQFLPSATITVLNVIIPIIYQKIVAIEDYTPSVEIKVTLLRTVFLRLASLGMLLLSVRQLVDGANSERSMIVHRCGNKRWQVTTNTTEIGVGIKCWETYFGQQIYKLIVLDFLVVVIVTIVVEFPRKLIYKNFHTKVKLVELVGQQEFNLPKSVLDIVYSQALCWIGLFFSPLVPAICMVKCFIFFYVKKVSLLYNCMPQSRQYRTSRSNSLFMSVLLLSFLLAALPLSYVITRMQPSQSCGPFRLYSDSDFVIFSTITNTINSWPSQARDVFNFLGTAGFLAPAMVFCLLLMVYFIVGSQAQKQMGMMLREQLILEGRDKQFLLARVNEVLLMFSDMKKSSDVVVNQDVFL